MGKRTRRSPARFLAPLALIAVVVALLMIVNNSSTNKSSSSPLTTPTTTTTSTAKKSKTTSATSTTRTSSSSRTYTVQVGDTLGGIASKTGVPLDQIQTLNPNVDPHAMVTGQKIRLR